MRKIKFRAWDKLDKKMHRVCRLGMSGFSHHFWSPSPVACDSRTNCDQYVIMQSTGLRDKYGKEIYEGDIVIADDNDECFPSDYDEETDTFTPTSKWEVYWHKAMWWLRNKSEPGGIDMDWNPFTGDATFEVIGNIYENPELLK